MVGWDEVTKGEIVDSGRDFGGLSLRVEVSGNWVSKQGDQTSASRACPRERMSGMNLQGKE